MKKVLFSFAAIVILLFGAMKVWESISYGGTSYYAQIKSDGKKYEDKSDSGEIYTRYEYNQAAFKNSGDEKSVTFTADHNLRKEAYLKLTYNESKGVTNWEEVQKSEISKSALDGINRN
ncbi:MAG: YxeA family protein [Streptococcaceae bacterium]|nr:YxeA family protein [Streptococcaceae bacterium]